MSEQDDDHFAQNRKISLDKAALNYSPVKAKAKYDKQLKEWKAQIKIARAAKKKAPRRPRLQTDPLKNQNYPSNLYNGMINPLLPYAIKGAIWYQGEANARSIESSEHYRIQLDRMITSWRAVWGQDFPFYPVQLPNFRNAQRQPVESADTWPVIRESFAHVAVNTPGVGTASMIDIGEAKNIHPKNKQEVGRRLASTILNETYGLNTPTPPFIKCFEVEDSKVVIAFDYAGTGLVAKGGKLKSFAIAGADMKFVWADAKIETREVKTSFIGGLMFWKKALMQDVVIVSSSKIKKPLSVRYAWVNNPAECNLYSNEGYPASPFRTDDWPLSNK